MAYECDRMIQLPLTLSRSFPYDIMAKFRYFDRNATGKFIAMYYVCTLMSVWTVYFTKSCSYVLYMCCTYCISHRITLQVTAISDHSPSKVVFRLILHYNMYYM